VLEWKPEYSVDNASIDHEHEMMIGQINKLINQISTPVGIEALDAETIESVLGEIHANISAHFALEETLMLKANYVEYKDHKEDHEDLLDQIHDLIDLLYRDPDAGRKQLNLVLSTWFSHHFSTFDARLHRQLG
jgi:hemerythrin